MPAKFGTTEALVSAQARTKRCRTVLEKRAIRILSGAGLSHRRTRKQQDGNVDMLFESGELLMRTWHVRFKQCAELTMDDAATEVGIAQGCGNRVALVAGTGRISSAARRYAAYVTARTHFQVILLDGPDLQRAEHNPRRLRETIAIQAPLALVTVPAKQRHPSF
jgi:hypothetical protein